VKLVAESIESRHATQKLGSSESERALQASGHTPQQGHGKEKVLQKVSHIVGSPQQCRRTGQMGNQENPGGIDDSRPPPNGWNHHGTAYMIQAMTNEPTTMYASNLRKYRTWSLVSSRLMKVKTVATQTDRIRRAT